MSGIVVEVQGLTHRYGPNVILDDVDLTVDSATRHAIIGANGAGKTTLLGLITGTARPSQGRILYDGVDVTRLPLHRRAQHGMTRTWQHPAIIESLTAIDNVALAIRRTRLRNARTAAAELLHNAGLHDAATLAGHLPYGQRRLLELITALAPRPRLLILDEPSAGLDQHETAQLLNRLLGVADTTTILMTDHSRALVTTTATAVTVLDHGKPILDGTPTAVFADARMHQRTASPADHAHRRPSVPASASRGPTALLIADLNAGYQGHHVLRDIDLSVQPGEVVAIVGRDGAGRSTLIRALTGVLPVYPPTRITMTGLDITTLTPARRAAAGLGTVPQQRPPAPHLSVSDQLRTAGASVDQLPHAVLRLAPWLPHRLRQPVDSLSGGERQVLAIACALAKNPKVLLLDEATEGLAADLVVKLQQLIRELATQHVAVLLTDSLSGPHSNAADRVHLLNNGSLTAPATWT
ncbi:hypothetical protein GCM10009827_101600 [Dactylosporangium maewongense]|uniref:ABC transporter domain-containing protein n=1 Tax=Dactylosporangium maewongense TaxID=634393 RepID=A0ABN2CSQ7_9ACTN